MLAIGRACRGQDLRLKGHNRIGNMIVPNDNYCRFEEWFQPLLDEMLASQIDEVRASATGPREAHAWLLTYPYLAPLTYLCFMPCTTD